MKEFELEGVLARDANEMEWLLLKDTPGFGGVVVAVEIGLLTPPLGLGVFAVAAAVDEKGVTVEDVFRGSMPFVVMMTITLAILIAFPGISTLLPSFM